MAPACPIRGPAVAGFATRRGRFDAGTTLGRDVANRALEGAPVDAWWPVTPT